MVFCASWVFLSLQGNIDAVAIGLAFGILALSTAPAATLALIHQYRSKGPLTDTLPGVVDIDDAVGIMGYSSLLSLAAENSIGGGILQSFTKIGGADVIGTGAGWLLSRLSSRFGASGFRTPIILSSILIVLGMAENLRLSQFLAVFSLGFATRFFCGASAGRLFNPIHPLEETIYLLFFTIAGTHFNLD